jgi:hypothetical protein
MLRKFETRLWAPLSTLGPIAILALAGGAIDCGGPEAFRGSHLAGGGNAGSTVPGTAGASGSAGGQGTAGGTSSGTAGDTPPLPGTAGGSGAAGTGTAGMAGTAGAGTAGAAGDGATGGMAGDAGGGGAGAGGMAGTMGTAGMAGTSGIAGAGGAAGGGGGMAGTTGTAGAGGAGGSPAGCNCMLKVQYECRQNGASVTQAAYSIKVVNTGTTSIPLNTVNVRYWYTIDGTGAQAGTCASMAHPCTIAFQNPTTNKPTADQYAVISFSGGTLAPGADTGEIQVTMQGSGTYNQNNDYSFQNTGANFLDDMKLTGYASGKLIWGTAP